MQQKWCEVFGKEKRWKPKTYFWTPRRPWISMSLRCLVLSMTSSTPQIPLWIRSALFLKMCKFYYRLQVTLKVPKGEMEVSSFYLLQNVLPLCAFHRNKTFIVNRFRQQRTWVQRTRRNQPAISRPNVHCLNMRQIKIFASIQARLFYFSQTLWLAVYEIACAQILE